MTALEGIILALKSLAFRLRPNIALALLCGV